MRRAGYASPLRWTPTIVQFQSLTLSRLKHDIQLQADFGPSNPPGQPADQKYGLYVAEPKAKPGSFKRFTRLAREEAPLIAASIAAVGLYTTATLAIPHGFGELIDHASRGEMPFMTSMKLLAWFVAAGMGNFARLALVGIAGERLIARLRERLFKSMMKQPTAFFDSSDNRTGGLNLRLTMDTNVVGSSLSEAVNQGAKNIVQMIGSLGVMLYFSPQLTGVILFVLPPVAIIAGQYGRFIRRLQAQKQDAIANMGTVAEERLSNVRTVKAFAHEKHEVSLFNSKVQRVLKVSRFMALWNASYVSFLHVSGYFTLYCIVWGGSMLVAANDLTAGTLFSFMLYTIYCGIGITGVTNLISEVNKGYGASLRMFDIIDKADAIVEEEKKHKGIRVIPCRGLYQFEAVSFAYPTRPEVTVFKNISFAIMPGKCTVVVSSSGGGKSTIAQLLLKLYEPSTGKVTLDGHDLNTIDTTWLRNSIGYVAQEPVLFGGTVAQNIAYGISNREWEDKMDSFTTEAVVTAAVKANAHDFVSSLPEKYDTFVGEGGRSLSGGQKQRIAIARALIKLPQLLILDEATSALDAESELVVQAAIEKLIQDTRVDKTRAVLMFAHRLSMIKQADTIVVMRDGNVIDCGSYEDVLRNPYFRQLIGVTETGDVDTTKNNLTDLLRPAPDQIDRPAQSQIDRPATSIDGGAGRDAGDVKKEKN